MKTRRKSVELDGTTMQLAAPLAITAALGALRISAAPPPATASRLPWLTAAVRSDVGQQREDNQDSVFALAALLPSPAGGVVPFGFFAVADGMGGLAGGAAASRLAIETVAARVTRDLLLPALAGQGGQGNGRTVSDILSEALTVAGKQIYAAARRAGSPSGTTFSGVVLLGRQLVTAHVGDSRIYLGGPAGLTPITEDHSVVARLVAMGQLTAADVKDNPQRNVLYRSLGQADEVVVETATHPWRGATHLLLCSDGLWDLLDDSELTALLRAAPDLDGAADALVAAANGRGGRDNISLILVRLPADAA